MILPISCYNPTPPDSKRDDPPTVLDSKRIETIALDVQQELEQVENKCVQRQLQIFMAHYLHLKRRQGKEKIKLDRESVLMTLKENLDEMAGNEIQDSDGKCLDVDDGILATASKTLSRFQKLSKIPNRLAATNDMILNVCENIGRRAKNEEESATPKEWGKSLSQALFRLNEKLFSAGKRTRWERESILKQARSDFERAEKEYDHWKIRLEDLQGVAAHKNQCVDILKNELKSHHGIQMREAHRRAVEDTVKGKAAIVHDLSPKLDSITRKLIDERYNLEQQTSNDRCNLRETAPRLGSYSDIFKSLHQSLLTSLSKLKSLSLSSIRDRHRVYKMTEALENIKKEADSLLQQKQYIEALVKSDSEEAKPIADGDTDSHEATLKLRLRDENKSEREVTTLDYDDLTSCLGNLKSIIVRFDETCKTVVDILHATRLKNSIVSFSTFKLEVMEMDLCHEKAFAYVMQGIPTMRRALAIGVSKASKKNHLSAGRNVRARRKTWQKTQTKREESNH